MASPGTLTADLDDPVQTASGSLGGEVLTATLNVRSSDDGLLAHPSGVPFGNLVLQNLESIASDPSFGNGVGPEIAELDGMSVRTCWPTPIRCLAAQQVRSRLKTCS